MAKMNLPGDETSRKGKKKDNKPKVLNELLKHIQRVRAYMQNFYIYGFLTRDDYGKDESTYDNERHRVECWMAPYYGFNVVNRKRICFVSFDSRSVRRNPLYRALKSKSFTKNDIALHFLILDVMQDGEERDVEDVLYECESLLGDGGVYEASIVKAKLDEYEKLGVLASRKEGRDKYYRLAPFEDVKPLAPALAFFSEAAECGVVGSYLEDRLEETCEAFSMKHHYIAQTLDTELIHTLLEAMHTSSDVVLEHMDGNHRKTPRPLPPGMKPLDEEKQRAQRTRTMLPLYILRSVQDGRVFVLGWGRKSRSFVTCRLDKIATVKILPKAADSDENEVQTLRAAYDQTRDHRWGASLNGKVLQHIDFTIRVAPWEPYVRRRMHRECRGGSVEELEGGRLMRFSAELYDPLEIVPWVRSFVGRIVDINCDNPAATQRFLDDLAQMSDIYMDEPEERKSEGEVSNG